MTLIDRYLIKAFLKVLFWSILAFIAIFLLVDLFDHLDNFLDDNARIVSVFRYYLFKLPLIIDLCLPIGMLLASLFTLGTLSKNNEFAALLSSGVSLARAGRSLLVLGLLMSMVALVFREYVVPYSSQHQDDVFKYEIEGKIRQDLKAKRNFTYIGQKGEVYIISAFRPKPPTLSGFSMEVFADSVMVRRVDAQRARWDGKKWVAKEGTIRTFKNGKEMVTPFSEYRIEESNEKPADFSRREVDPENMNYFELARFAEWVGRNGGNPIPYRATMANKLAFPLVNLLMVVLGISLGAGRQKTTLWTGFGLTMGLAAAYWILMDFGLSLGKTGAMPVWASAWSPNILYGALGLILFYRANR